MELKKGHLFDNVLKNTLTPAKRNTFDNVFTPTKGHLFDKPMSYQSTAKPIVPESQRIKEEPVGTLQSFAKGIIGMGAQLPQVAGTLIKEIGETEQMGDIKIGLLGPISLFGIGNITIPVLSQERKERLNEAVAEFGENVTETNKRWVEEKGLLPQRNEKMLAYQLGSGIASLGTAVGLTIATKNPAAATAVFGLMAKSRTYEEATEAGKTPEEAKLISTLAGLTEGALEYVGISKFMKPVFGTKILGRAISRFATEATQEGLQEFGSNAWARIGYDQKRNLMQGVNEAVLIGGIIGGASSIAVSPFEKSTVKEIAKDNGLNEEEASYVGDKLVPNLTNQFQSGMKKAFSFVNEQVKKHPIGLTIKEVHLNPTVTQHSIRDISKIAETKNQPEIAKKIAGIELPSEIKSIKELENIIKAPLTPKELEIANEWIGFRIKQLEFQSDKPEFSSMWEEGVSKKESGKPLVMEEIKSVVPKKREPLKQPSMREEMIKQEEIVEPDIGEKISKLHPDDEKVIKQFIDNVRLRGKEDLNLEFEASRIAEHYGIKMPNTRAKLANEFSKVLDEREKKIKVPVEEVKEIPKKLKSQKIPIANTVKEKVRKVFKLMGNDIIDVSIIGSTAEGKLKPNDLDVLVIPKKYTELTSDKLYDRIELQNLIAKEIKDFFPDKKIHVTISKYKTERGAKMSLEDFYDKETKGIKSPSKPRVLKVEQKVEKQRQLKQQRDIIRQQLVGINQVIKEHPAAPLARYAVNGELPEVTGQKGFSIFKQKGDDIVTEFGFVDSEEARDSYNDLQELKEKQKELRDQLSESFLDPEFKTTEVSALGKKVKKAETKISKIKTAKKILQRRRASINAIKEHFGLSDTDLKNITKRDIRLMSNFEFKQFIDNIQIEAEKFAEKQQAMNELLQQIKDKELNVENLRKAMKLPTMKNMTTEDIRKLDEALKPYKTGDIFLSVRKLETVDRTELKGIKTWREARERLAKRRNTTVEKLETIKVSEFDRFRFDSALAERNDFYKMMVELPAATMLNRQAEYLTIEEKTYKIAKGIKPKGIIGRLVPQQKIVRKFIESPIEKKPEVVKEMTSSEIELATYMTKELEKARDYLVKMEAMKMGRENYFTHIRRGTLETIKEDGFIRAGKEILIKEKQEEQNFEILDRITGEVLALDKFFKFAMHRTGQLVPTENTVKAFLSYMKTFKRKQALDEIVPLIDIYAHSLTPKETTKTGLFLHGNLIKFVKEYLNTKKGRHITLIAKQGGKIDRVLRVGMTLTSLRDLAGNIPVSIASELGEQATTYQLLGKKNYLRGKIRQNTKQGRRIIEKYRNFIGKNPWKELVEPAKEIGEKMMEGTFVLFRDSSERANKTFLLGSLSQEEFNKGEISSERLASLKTELGRYRVVEDTASIIGATPEGRQYTQYKKWAIPNLTTTIKNLDNITIKLKDKNVSSETKKKSALELYRAIELTAFVLAIYGLIGGEDDDSFVGKIKAKAYREAMTLVQALNPKTFLAVGRLASFIEDFGDALSLLITLERYKESEKLKGVEKMKRLFKPVVVKHAKEIFSPEEINQEERIRTRTRTQDREKTRERSRTRTRSK